MVEESRLPVSVVPDDLRSATAVAKVARIAEAPDIVEYWKSAPYLLNFMRDYVLKRKIKAHDGKHAPVALLDAIRSARPSCLIWSRIQDYRPLKPPNGRMRLLMEEVFSDELEKHLWIPPSTSLLQSRIFPRYPGKQVSGVLVLVYGPGCCGRRFSPTKRNVGWV